MKNKNFLFIILVFIIFLLVFFVIEFLPYNENKDIVTNYIQFSCRKDLGICEYDGKICFKNYLDTTYGKILYNPIYCDTNIELNSSCKKPKSCAIYFTGIGCPHCAKVDPYLFYRFIPNNELIVIEYEVYKSKDGAKTMDWYINNIRKDFKFAGIPQIYFNNDLTLIGDLPILQNLYSYFIQSDGICEINIIKKVIFNETQEANDNDNIWFSGNPKIWYCDRVLVIKNNSIPSEEFIRAFFSEKLDIEYIKEKFS